MNRYEHEIINDDSSLRLFFRPIHTVNGYSPLHWHSHLEILLILDGYMTAFIGEKKYTLKKDDILVVNPRELHSTKTFGETDYILLQIPYDYLAGALEQVSLLHFQTYFPSITMNSTQKKLHESLLVLLDTYREKEDGYQLYFSSVIYEFLYILYKYHSRKITKEAREKENRNLEKIEETIQYVKDNYKRNITLKEAADLLNVSPEYFCRLFKKHTGQTFLEYLNAVRMIHFYHDLIQTDYSITDLMEQNGITNYKVFSRMFKETYQTTPGKLRQRKENKNE
ncbi:MAG: helix-turn-helix transcriptional regulator [Lachnospiraceae bacterium]|nr:helix-turn-helix transcriptional regulator [Lachnospiraceae bacterium]